MIVLHQGGEMMPAWNYNRGFRRIGFLTSVAWAIFVLEDSKDIIAGNSDNPDHPYVYLASVALGGPVICLLLYMVGWVAWLMIDWVAEGFRND